MDLTWPWETEAVVQDTVGMLVMIVLSIILSVVGLLILTGKIPMPAGMPGRLLAGFGVLGVGIYILLGVAA